MKTKYLVAVLVTAAGCTVDNTVVSEGDRVGVVTKLSHKRMECGAGGQWNWEGELSMPGGTTAAGQGGEGGGQVGAWAFSLSPSPEADNQTVLNHLRESLNTGHTVRAHYRQVREHNSCIQGTDYIVLEAADLTGGKP